jgi:hypothetical protein
VPNEIVIEAMIKGL